MSTKERCIDVNLDDIQYLEIFNMRQISCDNFITS